jgi:hypothetical protein
MATPHELPSVVYIVVEVMSGIAAGAVCFRREADAASHAATLRRAVSPNDDDVQVFECVVIDDRAAA